MSTKECYFLELTATEQKNFCRALAKHTPYNGLRWEYACTYLNPVIRHATRTLAKEGFLKAPDFNSLVNWLYAHYTKID